MGVKAGKTRSGVHQQIFSTYPPDCVESRTYGFPPTIAFNKRYPTLTAIPGDTTSMPELRNLRPQAEVAVTDSAQELLLSPISDLAVALADKCKLTTNSLR